MFSEFITSLPEDELIYLVKISLCFVVMFGAIVGSFLNVCIYRIPLEQSVSFPRSHCFSCGKLIPWYFNIPILSWLMLRGKCAYCKSPISPRYLIIEALTGFLFLLTFLKWGNPNLFGMVPETSPILIPVYWAFISSLIVGSFIDLDHYIIPDRCTIGGIVFGLVISGILPELHNETIWWQGLLQGFIGFAVGFGLLYGIGWLGKKAFKKEAMGFGDVKWVGAFGAFFGFQGALFIIMAGSFLGSIIGILLMVLRRAKGDTMIPFGPYLAMSALIWLFWGQRLIDLYFRFVLQME